MNLFTSFINVKNKSFPLPEFVHFLSLPLPKYLGWALQRSWNSQFQWGLKTHAWPWKIIHVIIMYTYLDYQGFWKVNTFKEFYNILRPFLRSCKENLSISFNKLKHNNWMW